MSLLFFLDRATAQFSSSSSSRYAPAEPVRIPITDVLDLHTVPVGDLSWVLEEYLREAHELGLKALRIIHGRGIGVQRETVRGILARTPFVKSFGDAPLEAGGWGAT